MMKVFVDTNVLLDYLLERKDFVEEAKSIFLLGNAGHISIMITDLSVANVAYITRNKIPLEQFFSTLSVLRRFCKVISMGEDVVDKAIKARWSDFEDSLQYFAAIQAAADCIITRNVKDFYNSEIPVLEPSAFVDMITSIGRHD